MPRVICTWYSVNNLYQQMHLTTLGPVLQWFMKDWNYSINYLLQIVYAALDHSWVDLILLSLAPVFANGAKDSQRRALLLKTSMKGSKITSIQSTHSIVQLLANSTPANQNQQVPRGMVETFSLPWKLLGFCKCWSTLKSLCHYRPRANTRPLWIWVKELLMKSH